MEAVAKKSRPSRKNPLPRPEQSANGLYLTPGWMVRLWVAHHKPRLPGRVLDAGAADGRLGRAFGARRSLDTDPLHLCVRRADLFDTAAVRDVVGGGDVSVVSNPPFSNVQAWLERCLELAGATGDVSLLLRCGTQQQVSWRRHARRAVLPKRRVSFEITEEYALELISRGKDAHRCDCPTGWRLGSPGDDHGIFVYEPGWDAECSSRWVDVAPYLAEPSIETEEGLEW